MKHGRTVLVVDDEASIADGLRLTLEAEGYSVRIAGSVATALLGRDRRPTSRRPSSTSCCPDGDGLALTRELKKRDPTLEVVIVTAYGSVRKAMEATKGAGAFYVLEKPFDPDELIGARRARARSPQARRRERGAPAPPRSSRPPTARSSASAPSMQRVMETIVSVADTDANVLIVGESGTGKELIANALHEQQPAQATGPWIKINCAALPKDLIESELFGHTKGAFTGATTDKVGLLEEAHRARSSSTRSRRCRSISRPSSCASSRSAWCAGSAAPKSVPVDFRLISSTNRAPEVARQGRPPAPGPLLPHQHGDDRGAAAARAPRRHPDPRAGLPRALPRQARAPGRGDRARGVSAAPRVRVARQRARAAARDRARGARRPRTREITVADLPEALQHGAASRRGRRRAVRGAVGLAGGHRARVDPEGARCRRDGTSRPRPPCSASGGPRSTRRCGSTTSRSAAAWSLERFAPPSAIRPRAARRSKLGQPIAAPASIHEQPASMRCEEQAWQPS